MIVCICHRVSDHTIVREVRAGCASFDELQDTLRVATACGACADCARDVFAEPATHRIGRGAQTDGGIRLIVGQARDVFAGAAPEQCLNEFCEHFFGRCQPRTARRRTRARWRHRR